MNTKHIVFTILTVLFSLSAFSQSKSGIKGGLNFTNLYISEVDDENMKIGFNAGLYHRAGLTNLLDLQTEFLFSQKGAALHYDGGIFTGSGHYRFNLNYLEVPVLLVLKAGSLNIHAGPYLGFLVSANVKDVDEDGSIKDFASLDRDDFNTFDYGISGGVGFDFERGTIGVRYNYGFVEIGESGVAGKATTDSKNSALQLYLGFDF